MKAWIVLTITALTLMASPAAAQTQEDAPTRVTDGDVVVTDVAMRVGGNPVEHLSPGESTEVTLTLRNDGREAIRDGVLQLEAFGQGTEVNPDSIALDDLPIGDTVRVTFTLTVSRAACYEPLGLGASIRYGEAMAFIKTEIPAVCPGSKIAFWTVRYEGGDGDGVPEPGEELDVFVTLRNDGRDPGRSLRGTITSPTQGVRVLDGDSRWPDINKGEEIDALDPFRIAIADDVKTNANCGSVRTTEVPVADGDDVVSSDGDGPPDRPATDGKSDAGAGGDGEPGSTGSAGATEPAPEDGAIEPDNGSSEPDPKAEEEPMAPASDPSASFDLQLSVRGEDTELEMGIGSGTMCTMEDAARSGGGEDELLAIDQVGTEAAAADGSGPTIMAGLMLAGVAAALVLARRRYFSATQ